MLDGASTILLTAQVAQDSTQQNRIEKRFSLAQDRLIVQASDLSLQAIADMVRGGAIDVAPQFQRRDRWTNEQQSSLIESFLLNVPVPPVYLSEDDFGSYSVIDGKQRITTIKAFMGDELQLRTLASFSELEGYRFSELPTSLRNALQVRPYVRAVTLLRQTAPDLKYEVFHRLNSGGQPLNAQEIRNVVYRGSLNNLIMRLSETPFLRHQLKIRDDRSPAYRTMTDAEFVLRFFALSRTWRHFSGDLRRTMDDYMRDYRDPSESTLAANEELFLHCLDVAADIWGSNAFKRFEKGVWRDQFLAGMYDAQMVALAELIPSERQALRAVSNRVAAGIPELFEDEAFEASVRAGTNTPSRIRYRTEQMISFYRNFV